MNARVVRYCEVYGIPLPEWHRIASDRPLYPAFVCRAWTAWCHETGTPRVGDKTPAQYHAFDRWLRTYTPEGGTA